MNSPHSPKDEMQRIYSYLPILAGLLSGVALMFGLLAAVFPMMEHATRLQTWNVIGTIDIYALSFIPYTGLLARLLQVLGGKLKVGTTEFTALLVAYALSAVTTLWSLKFPILGMTDTASRILGLLLITLAVYVLIRGGRWLLRVALKL